MNYISADIPSDEETVEPALVWFDVRSSLVVRVNVSLAAASLVGARNIPPGEDGPRRIKGTNRMLLARLVGCTALASIFVGAQAVIQVLVNAFTLAIIGLLLGTEPVNVGLQS